NSSWRISRRKRRCHWFAACRSVSSAPSCCADSIVRGTQEHFPTREDCEGGQTFLRGRSIKSQIVAATQVHPRPLERTSKNTSDLRLQRSYDSCEACASVDIKHPYSGQPC